MTGHLLPSPHRSSARGQLPPAKMQPLQVQVTSQRSNVPFPMTTKVTLCRLYKHNVGYPCREFCVNETESSRPLLTFSPF